MTPMESGDGRGVCGILKIQYYHRGMKGLLGHYGCMHYGFICLVS